jgi:hypothetical protein
VNAPTLTARSTLLSPRGDGPCFLQGMRLVNRWMRGWTNPTREEQDRLAEDIRSARVAARVAVALAGGPALMAYVAALRATLLPGDGFTRRLTAAEAERFGYPELVGEKALWSIDGVYVGRQQVARADIGRAAVEAKEACGNQSRLAAGSATRRAIEILTALEDARAAGDRSGAVAWLAAEAAALDLEVDPSLGALDAARDALVAARKRAEPSSADRDALAALTALERAVGAAVRALRGHVVQVLLLASMRDHLEGPFGGDALTGGAEGLRRAIRVYQQGPKCMGSFARANWIVTGAVRALRGVWGGAARTAGVEVLSLDFELQEQGAHAVEVGKDGATTAGLRGTAESVVGDEGPEVALMARERAADLRATVAALPAEERSACEEYLQGRRANLLQKRNGLGRRVIAGLRDLIGDVGCGAVPA